SSSRGISSQSDQTFAEEISQPLPRRLAGLPPAVPREVVADFLPDHLVVVRPTLAAGLLEPRAGDGDYLHLAASRSRALRLGWALRFGRALHLGRLGLGFLCHFTSPPLLRAADV